MVRALAEGTRFVTTVTVVYANILPGWILACVRFCPHLFKVRSTQLVVEKVLWSSVRINCFLSF